MPWIESCCCGFSVKSGTKAIAILSTLYSLMGMLSTGTYNYRKEAIFRDLNQASSIKITTEKDKMKWEFLFTAFAVFCSINFVVSLSLLMGVRLSNRWLLLPWITWTGLMLAVTQLAVFFIPHNHPQHQDSGAIRPTATIPDIFCTAFLIYCEVCVISYFQSLSASARDLVLIRRDRPVPLNTDLEIQSRPAVLTVSLPTPPEDRPPSYRPPDDPPAYDQADNDPPPPYPGSPTQDEEEKPENNTMHVQGIQGIQQQQTNPPAQVAQVTPPKKHSSF